MVRALLTFLKAKGAQKTILHFAGLVLLAAVILFATGCYETAFEVIDASSAVAVYGAPGNYTLDGGGSLTISAVPNSHDYRFRRVFKDGSDSKGYLRAIPLQGDIYIVQAKYDDQSFYYLAFYEFTIDSNGSHYKQMEPNVDEERLGQLAQQYDVKIDFDRFDPVFGLPLTPALSGTRSNIMAFLRAHASLPFSYSE
jgi:hypothetical protein